MSPRHVAAALAVAAAVLAGCSSDEGEEPVDTNVSDPSLAEQTIAPDDTTGD